MWISHRGLRLGGAPENSKKAFDQALSAGFETLETDLRLTKDGHIILTHDPNLKRLAQDSRPVSQCTRQEIETLGRDFLFFDDFMSFYKDLKLVLDIKKETGLGVIERLDPWLRTGGFLEKTYCLFWDSLQEAAFLKRYPRGRIFAGERACLKAGLSALSGLGFGIKKNQIYAVPPRFGPFDLFQEKILNRYKTKGAQVIAYLPKTESEVKSAMNLPFDFILTDGPRLHV
jgi:glycerophosphoryl diester phosphodiesterase